jgi:hypothetical protein
MEEVFEAIMASCLGKHFHVGFCGNTEFCHSYTRYSYFFHAKPQPPHYFTDFELGTS